MACYILGISAFYHDSACALLKDGAIIAAAQEERFTRKKNETGFPAQAIQYCLLQANIKLKDITYVTFYRQPLQVFRTELESYLASPSAGVSSFRDVMSTLLGEKLSIEERLKQSLLALAKGKKNEVPTLLFSDKHDAYAAAAFYPSPFSEAAILCLDDNRERSTTSVFTGKDSTLTPHWELKFPHSLGFVYSAFTEYLGFKMQEEESRIMDLAPFGKPVYSTLIKEKIIDIKADGTFHIDTSYFNITAKTGLTKSKLHKLFQLKPRATDAPITREEMDIACSLQAVTEEIILKLGATIATDTGLHQLCISGCMTFNTAAYTRLLKEGPFSHIWYQPAYSDAGGALGAALNTWHGYLDKPRATNEHDLQAGGLLGPDYNKLIEAMVVRQHPTTRRYASLSALVHATAKQLANDHIVGWYQGRMEYGTRALGNRSIFASPLNQELAQLLNTKLKTHLPYSPFSAIIKDDKVHEWFDVPRGRKSAFALYLAKIHPNKIINLDPEILIQKGQTLGFRASMIPGVTHIDYTARLQTVSQSTQPLLYALLDAFESMTGCPILINAALNLPGEPLVCTPLDAYQCFIQSGMDDLILGDFHFEKSKLKTNTSFEMDTTEMETV